MMRQGTSWVASVAVGVVLAAAGCNLVTGAGDLRIGDGEGSGQGGDSGPGAGGGGPAGPGSGGMGSGASGSGGPGSGGSMEQPLAFADGVTVTAIDLYQALRRPLMEGGQPATSDIPVVAKKPGMLRVFYETDGGYDGQPVTARLTVGSGAPVEVVGTLSGSSSHTDLGSTINIDFPGDIMEAGASFKVELLQPAASVSGDNSAAAYPSDGGEAPMEIEAGAVKLKIMLVPVQNNGTLPDTSAEQVQLYQRYFSEEYPVPEVEITVRSAPYVFNYNLGNSGNWSALLDEITDLRNSDGAPDDVYYYGIHDADGNGLLGLGWVGGASDVWSRTAIGVGWTGNTAPETAVHEVGHNHGRDHSPCGVSGDPSFPHPGASIGVWGYRPSDKQLLDPDDFVDFMSYCDPAWISDYTYKAIFQRAKFVSTSPFIAVPEALQNRSYDRIKVLDGQATFLEPVVIARPPEGETKSMTVSLGGEAQTLTGHYFAYNHLDGGVLLVMRPLIATSTNTFSQITFSAEGHTFTLSR
jgi:hypothetical protein